MANDGLLALAARLRRIRQAARLDEATLGRMAGISEGRIAAFESGSEPLGMAELVRIAGALLVPVASLLDSRTPEVAPPQSAEALLLSSGVAELSPSDFTLLEEGLDAAVVFADLGCLLGRPSLADDFSPRPAPKKDPHRKGYEAANSVRVKLHETGPLRSVRMALEESFGILVLFTNFATPWVLGASCRRGAGRLVVVDGSVSRVATLRWVLAHELNHHLCDLAPEGAILDDDKATMAFTMEKSPVEKRADAFAAMFLAPKLGVRSILNERNDAAAKALQCASTFGMGFDAAVWHLKNLGYYDDTTARSLITHGLELDLDSFDEGIGRRSLTERIALARKADLISSARARELQSIADRVGA